MTSLHQSPQVSLFGLAPASAYVEGRPNTSEAAETDGLDEPFDLDLEQRSVLEAEVLLWRIRLSRAHAV